MRILWRETEATILKLRWNSFILTRCTFERTLRLNENKSFYSLIIPFPEGMGSKGNAEILKQEKSGVLFMTAAILWGKTGFLSV